MRTLECPAPSIRVRQGSDGIVYLGCRFDYQPGQPAPIDHLHNAVTLRPETTFLAERDGQDRRRRLTYALELNQPGTGVREGCETLSNRA